MSGDLYHFLVDGAGLEISTGRRRRHREEDSAWLALAGVSEAQRAAVLALFHPEPVMPPPPPRQRAVFGPLE